MYTIYVHLCVQCENKIEVGTKLYSYNRMLDRHIARQVALNKR